MSQTSDNNKRIAKNTLMLYFRMLFMMLVALYTSRVVLQVLGVEDYGIYNVVGGVVTMFSFVNNAMVSATQRFITFALGKGEGKRLRTVFSTAVQIHAAIALCIVILGETVGLWFLNEKMVIPEERMAAAQWVYQFSIISCGAGVMSAPYNAEIVAHEKMSAFAYISIVEVTLKLLIVFLLTLSPIDRLIMYALLLLLVQLAVILIYLRYCRRHFAESVYRPVFDRKLLKEMTSFAGWSFFGSFAVSCCNQGVNIVLNMFFGPVVNAARGIALSVQTIVNNFSSNFQMALNPQIIKTYATGKLDEHRDLVFMACKFSVLLLMVISLPILLNTQMILHLWLGEVPKYTVSFIQIILVLAVWDSATYPLATSVQATGKIRKYQLVISCVIFLILPVSYVILSIYKVPEFALLVHFFFAVLAQIVRLVFLRNLIGLKVLSFLKRVYVPAFLCMAVSFGLVYCLSQNIHSETWKFVGSIVLVTVLSVTLSYFVVLNKREKMFVHGMANKVLSKLNRNK